MQLGATKRLCTQLAYYVIPYLLDPHDYRRRFSGPWLARFTNLWMSRIVTTGHHSEVIRELHEKYGKASNLFSLITFS